MPDHKDSAEQSKLISQVAANIGHDNFSSEVIKLVASQKIDPTAFLFDDVFGQKSLYHLAAEMGNFTVVQYLIDNGLVDINQLTNGEPPRHALDFMCNGLIEDKHEAIIEYLLLQPNLNIDELDEQGLNQLDQVLYHNNCGRLLLLLTSRQNFTSVGNKLIQRELFSLKFGLDDSCTRMQDKAQAYSSEMSIPSDLSLTLPYLQSSLVEFASLSNDTNLQSISNVFLHNSICHFGPNSTVGITDFSNIVKRYQAGHMVVIHGRENSQTASYVLEGGTLYHCSSQPDDLGQMIIKNYIIDDAKKIDSKIFDILLHTTAPEKALKLTLIHKSIGPALIGNNQLNAPQQALYAMILHVIGGDGDSDSLTLQVKGLYSSWLNWDRKQQIDHFGQSFSDNPPLLENMLQEALPKLVNEPDLIEHLNAVLKNGANNEPHAKGKHKHR
tara:strand:- start:30246 stop:31568 length:1323 start_codon:yes stop_codon:yes gene_type:complete